MTNPNPMTTAYPTAEKKATDQGVDLDTALAAYHASIRTAHALERLSHLPETLSQVARAIEAFGERVEYGFERLAGSIEGRR